MRGARVVGHHCRMCIGEQSPLVDSSLSSAAVEDHQDTPKVILFGGDPVSAQALTLLLRTKSYNVRFAPQSYLDDPDDEVGLIEDAQLVLLAPGMTSGNYARILELIASSTAATGIPVLQLGSPHEESYVAPEYRVSWPCRIEHLRECIENALRARARDVEEASQAPHENEAQT